MSLRAIETVYWPGIWKAVSYLCKVCQNSTKGDIAVNRNTPSRWEQFGLDIFSLKETQYLLTVDYFSWFPIIRKLHSFHLMNQNSEGNQRTLVNLFIHQRDLVKHSYVPPPDPADLITALTAAIAKLLPNQPSILLRTPSFDWNTTDQYDFCVFHKSVESWFTLQNLSMERVTTPDPDAELLTTES